MTDSFNGKPEAKSRFMIDIFHLAVVTDSTRAISRMTFGITGENQI